MLKFERYGIMCEYSNNSAPQMESIDYGIVAAGGSREHIEALHKKILASPNTRHEYPLWAVARECVRMMRDSGQHHIARRISKKFSLTTDHRV